jgi:hypothetical protein
MAFEAFHLQTKHLLMLLHQALKLIEARKHLFLLLPTPLLPLLSGP